MEGGTLVHHSYKGGHCCFPREDAWQLLRRWSGGQPLKTLVWRATLVDAGLPFRGHWSFVSSQPFNGEPYSPVGWSKMGAASPGKLGAISGRLLSC